MILAYFFVLPLPMVMAEDSPKVACNFSEEIKPSSEILQSDLTWKGTNLGDFSFMETFCMASMNGTKFVMLSYKNEQGKIIYSRSNESKPNVTLDDIINSKITNPKFSPNRKHYEKIIFDQTVAFIGDMRQLVTLKQKDEHLLYNFYFTESSLNLSDKKRFLVQERKDAGGKTFVVLSNKANSSQKIVFYKKEGERERIFYYIAPEGNWNKQQNWKTVLVCLIIIYLICLSLTATIFYYKCYENNEENERVPQYEITVGY